ncbi:DUF6339 family protein [Mollicutes bacterium LVI A0039]|nr:DUF6339 family protein [Mollicutes bacterium LVI A0039]
MILNNVEIYNESDVVTAKRKLIEESLNISEINIIDDKTDIFDNLIMISETIDDLSKDIELAIAMDKHHYFNSLTKQQATKEELWTTLNIEYFDTYTQRRWIKKNPSENQIKQRIFKSGKMLFNRNSLARLWWITKRTKDATLEDPYLYTRILLTRTQFDQSILESTIAKNDEVLKKFLSSLVRFETEIKTVSSEDIKDIMKRLNVLGGTYVIDIMDEDYFFNVICNVLDVEYSTNLFSEGPRLRKSLL